ncbi:class I SAM-dependent methyltransferase [uncultured Tateyamaria sp.]|uniref:class I SAM-dependent methyltransferase n=1 Tax=uncultured Tateyamaria sp. TaxID=455651 RepID=UPI0026140BA9|nr:class I SAM-dependent methyltransferase [uncultured Tateyamaria sp.]
MKLFRPTKRSTKKDKKDVAVTQDDAEREAQSSARSSRKPPQDPAQSSRLLNRIADHFGFTDYLEVGVQLGITFKAIEVSYRDAVDPNFLFETPEFESDIVRFFPMTSDAYFSGPCDKTYDLIFLDGLHTFEQCFRDLCAALQVLNDGGVIVIDDTVPGDFFSSLATQDLAIAAREEHGLKGSAWTGDVFKIIPVIHNFFPNLRYLTLHDPENPAYKPNTVLWRAKRNDFNPAEMSLTEVENLGYFDLSSIRELFKFVEYEEGLSILFNNVRKQN